MSNLTLNSLQFPGLSDTYKIPPQADEFSSTEIYSKGTYVTYQGQLYECTTAVTTAGSWTGSTNWTQINIGTVLENLTNDLSDKAPAGFGLGVQLNTLTIISDANDISQTGWFCTVSTTSNLPSDRDTSYAGVIESVVRGTTYMYQRYYDYHAAKIFERIKNENGWSSWKLTSPTATEQELAYVENGSTASRAYGIGEYFCLNGVLCKVTAEIASGAALTSGTNYRVVGNGGLNDLRMITSTASYDFTASYGSVQLSAPSDGYIVVGWYNSQLTNASDTLNYNIRNDNYSNGWRLEISNNTGLSAKTKGTVTIIWAKLV